MLTRETAITRILINNKGPTSKHVDPYSKLKLHDTANAHQHHQLRQKLEPCLQDPLEGDLSIILPKSVKVELQVRYFYSIYDNFKKIRLILVSGSLRNRCAERT